MSKLKGLVLTTTHVQFRDWCAQHKLNHREYKSLTKPDDLMGMHEVPVFQGNGFPTEHHRILDQMKAMGMALQIFGQVGSQVLDMCNHVITSEQFDARMESSQRTFKWFIQMTGEIRTAHQCREVAKWLEEHIQYLPEKDGR